MGRESFPAGAALLREEDLAVLAAGMRDLCFRMVSLQACADRVLKLLEEAAPSCCGGGAVESSVVYRPGPPRVLCLVLPEAPPRLEVHWGSWPGTTVYREVRDLWRDLVLGALEQAHARGAELPREPFAEAAAFFTFHFGGAKVRDVDNYTVRFIVNALRHAGVLAGDSFDRLSIAVRGMPDGPVRTEVVLVEDRELPFRSLWDQFPELGADSNIYGSEFEENG